MKIEIDKPVVSKWFDEWYKAMKYAEHRDAFILKVVSSVNQYDEHWDYSRDNVFLTRTNLHIFQKTLRTLLTLFNLIMKWNKNHFTTLKLKVGNMSGLHLTISVMTKIMIVWKSHIWRVTTALRFR